MPATTPGAPLKLQVPIREFGDLRNTVRLTDWTGGFDQDVLQEAFGILNTSPGYFDAQNIDPFTVPGTFRLTSRWIRIGSLESTDKEYLLYPFAAAVYIIPTTNFAAADFQKITQATGTPSKGALANIYPGAAAPRNAVVWREQLVVASAETVVRVMSSAEVWSTIAAPGGVTNPVCGQVGTSQQDKLAVWWEGTAGAGMYEYNGATWAQTYPPAGVTAPVAPTCDMIFDGPSSLLFATRDASGFSRLYEYLIQTTGSAFAIQIPPQQGLRFWPQACGVIGSTTYIGGRLAAMQNVGPIFVKEPAVPPDVLTYIDTNFATDNQKGLDWSARCVFSAGDVLHIGSSSRFDHKAANYRLEADAQGEIIHPGSVLDIDGPIYSLAMLPPAVAGAAAGERLFASVPKGLYYRDANNGVDPTTDAASGLIQFPDIDLGSPDHQHIWAAAMLDIWKRSVGGTINVQYRVDPKKLSDPWATLTPPGGGYLEGPNKLKFPDDNKAQRKRGTSARTLQVRVVLTAATSGLERDVVDTISLRWARTTALGAAV